MGKKDTPSAAALERARRKCQQQVMRHPGVSGVALTEVAGRPHIAVYVQRLTKDLRAQIADECDGVPVKIEVSGEFTAR